MVAFAELIRPWNDPVDNPAPTDGTPIEAEDVDGERVVVEWQEDTWVVARDVATGGWVTLKKAIARWRPLV